MTDNNDKFDYSNSASGPSVGARNKEIDFRDKNDRERINFLLEKYHRDYYLDNLEEKKLGLESKLKRIAEGEEISDEERTVEADGILDSLEYVNEKISHAVATNKKLAESDNNIPFKEKQRLLCPRFIDGGVLFAMTQVMPELGLRYKYSSEDASKYSSEDRSKYNFIICSKSEQFNQDNSGNFWKIEERNEGERVINFIFTIGTDNEGLDGDHYVAARAYVDQRTGKIVILHRDSLYKRVDDEFRNFIIRTFGKEATIVDVKNVKTESTTKEGLEQPGGTVTCGLYALNAMAAGGLFDELQDRLQDISMDKPVGENFIVKPKKAKQKYTDIDCRIDMATSKRRPVRKAAAKTNFREGLLDGRNDRDKFIPEKAQAVPREISSKSESERISILLEEYRSRRLDNLLNKKTKGKRSEIHSLIDAEDKFKDVNTTNLERQLLLKKDYMYSDELAAIALETPALKLTTDNFGIYSKSDKWNTDEDLYSKIATGERDYSFVFALGTDDDGLDGKRYVSGRFFRDKKTGAVLVLYSDPIGRKNIDNEFKNFVRKFLGDGAKIINTNGRRKAIDLSTEANPKELANGLYALDAVASGGLFDRVQNELEQLSSGKSQLPKGLEMSEITPMTRTEKEKERRVKNKKAVHTPKVMEFS